MVQCALAIEARSVAARLRRARRGSLGLFQAWDGTLAGVPALVVVSGMGRAEATLAAAEVIRLFEPCGLIGFGAAGALSETWAIGRCALVDRAIAYQPPRLIPPSAENKPSPTVAETSSDRDWLKTGRETLDLPAVRVGSADAPVTNQHVARHLAGAYGFDWVDCETHAVLDIAARSGIPAIGLRVVADHCGADAPEQFRQNARRVLRNAAKVLERYVGALHAANRLARRRE